MQLTLTRDKILLVIRAKRTYFLGLYLHETVCANSSLILMEKGSMIINSQYQSARLINLSQDRLVNGLLPWLSKFRPRIRFDKPLKTCAYLILSNLL